MFHSKIIPATFAGFVAVGTAIVAFAANGHPLTTSSKRLPLY
jgi:hypothetical protein